MTLEFRSVVMEDEEEGTEETAESGFADTEGATLGVEEPVFALQDVNRRLTPSDNKIRICFFISCQLCHKCMSYSTENEPFQAHFQLFRQYFGDFVFKTSNGIVIFASAFRAFQVVFLEIEDGIAVMALTCRCDGLNDKLTILKR